MSPEQKEGKTCLKMKIFCTEMFNLVIELRFQLLITQESNTERQGWIELKIALLRKAAVLGRQRTNAPKNQLLFADQVQEFLNGNFRSAQVEVFSGLTKLVH